MSGPAAPKKDTYEFHVWNAAHLLAEFPHTARLEAAVAASIAVIEKREGNPFTDPVLKAVYADQLKTLTEGPRPGLPERYRSEVNPGFGPPRGSFADRSQPPERDDPTDDTPHGSAA